MHTTKTTILPEDPAAARAEFDHWVHHEPVVLLVLLGSGAAVEATVADADKMANMMSDLAHVLWVRNPAPLKAQFSSLAGKPTLLKQLSSCQGFALSLTDRVVDVIGAKEAAPDLVRLLEAFTNALDDAGVGE